MLCLIWQGKLSIQDETEQGFVPELGLEGHCSVCGVQEKVLRHFVDDEWFLALKCVHCLH